MVSAVATPKAPITATGIKGFLLWFQREQPGIYQKIAPQLPAAAPKAFSNYNARVKRQLGRLGRLSSVNQKKVAAILRGPSFSSQRRQFLGDTSGDVAYSEVSYTAPPVSIDLTNSLNAPIDVGEINTGDAPDVNMPGTGSAGYPYSSGSPIATAANTGVSSTPTATAIGTVIGAASSAYLTSQQAALQNSIVQTNLQRAAAGLAPLNTSLNSLGVPTVGTSGSISSGGMLLLLGVGVAAVALLGGNKK